MKSAAPRLLAALVAGLSSALIVYAVFLSDGRPFPYHHRVPDVQLAYRMIPLELLTGLLVGGLVFWLFGRRQAGAPRTDVQERMLYRLAHRQGGVFTLPELETQSPLSAEQARQVVEHLLEEGRLKREGERYRLNA